jgi:hypothetical protein
MYTSSLPLSDTSPNVWFWSTQLHCRFDGSHDQHFAVLPSAVCRRLQVSEMCRLCGRVVKCIFDSMPSRTLTVASGIPARAISSAPRAHLFTRSTPRSYTVSVHRLASDQPSSLFRTSPAPLKLPKEEQEIFEALQRQSTGAFSTPRATPRINQSPDSTASDKAVAETEINDRVSGLSKAEQPKSQFQEDYKKIIEVKGNGEELHPNVRRGAKPEFEGDVNPKTGEVGGPRNEPLRWGAAGEWSYNGRTTDF